MSNREHVRITVAAAVIERPAGFLLTQRLAGTHLAGHWEFPGGKCEPHEDLVSCLKRELREELALDVVVGSPVCVARHRYAERFVELHFFRCEALNEPTPVLGQQMRWVPAQELKTLDLPEADALLIEQLAATIPPDRG